MELSSIAPKNGDFPHGGKKVYLNFGEHLMASIDGLDTIGCSGSRMECNHNARPPLPFQVEGAYWKMS
jgi:hypothetical protein